MKLAKIDALLNIVPLISQWLLTLDARCFNNSRSVFKLTTLKQYQCIIIWNIKELGYQINVFRIRILFLLSTKKSQYQHNITVTVKKSFKVWQLENVIDIGLVYIWHVPIRFPTIPSFAVQTSPSAHGHIVLKTPLVATGFISHLFPSTRTFLQIPRTFPSFTQHSSSLQASGVEAQLPERPEIQ